MAHGVVEDRLRAGKGVGLGALAAGRRLRAERGARRVRQHDRVPQVVLARPLVIGLAVVEVGKVRPLHCQAEARVLIAADDGRS